MIENFEINKIKNDNLRGKCKTFFQFWKFRPPPVCASVLAPRHMEVSDGRQCPDYVWPTSSLSWKNLWKCEKQNKIIFLVQIFVIRNKSCSCYLWTRSSPHTFPLWSFFLCFLKLSLNLVSSPQLSQVIQNKVIYKDITNYSEILKKSVFDKTVNCYVCDKTCVSKRKMREHGYKLSDKMQFQRIWVRLPKSSAIWTG